MQIMLLNSHLVKRLIIIPLMLIITSLLLIGKALRINKIVLDRENCIEI